MVTLPFNIGDYIENKKSGIVYRINGYGCIRSTGEHYFILDNQDILRESKWNNYFKKQY